MKNLGYGENYKYNPSCSEEDVKDQKYLPDYLNNRNFFSFRMHKAAVPVETYLAKYIQNKNMNEPNVSQTFLNTSTTTNTTSANKFQPSNRQHQPQIQQTQKMIATNKNNEHSGGGCGKY
jgi:hypothetical protein